MTMFSPRDQAARAVDPDWHAFRAEARHAAFNASQFSELDQERYDLDDQPGYGANYTDNYGEPKADGAGITGEDNPDTYRGQDRLAPEDTTSDMREDPMFTRNTGGPC